MNCFDKIFCPENQIFLSPKIYNLCECAIDLNDSFTE